MVNMIEEFERDWAKEFPDDPEAGLRFDKQPFGRDGWLYIDLTTRAAFTMYKAGAKKLDNIACVFARTIEDDNEGAITYTHLMFADNADGKAVHEAIEWWSARKEELTPPKPKVSNRDAYR